MAGGDLLRGRSQPRRYSGAYRVLGAARVSQQAPHHPSRRQEVQGLCPPLSLSVSLSVSLNVISGQGFAILQSFIGQRY